jgi:A/G-specific adenine glycosylase
MLGGLWEFPGGKLEPADPDLPACLRREIAEELGISIAVGDRVTVVEHAYTHFRITLHAFLCALINGEPAPLDAAALAWVVPGELGDYPMGKVDRQIAFRLAQFAGGCPKERGTRESPGSWRKPLRG